MTSRLPADDGFELERRTSVSATPAIRLQPSPATNSKDVARAAYRVQVFMSPMLTHQYATLGQSGRSRSIGDAKFWGRQSRKYRCTKTCPASPEIVSDPRQPFPFFFSFCSVQGGTTLFCRA